MKMVKTLIIDDDKLTCLLHTKLIVRSKIDPNPETFLKAEQALNFLKKNLKNEKHILILLDINMEEMNAWNFIEKLKTLDQNQKCDVVIISSSISHTDKIKASETEYVMDFIEKPLLLTHCERLKKMETIEAYFLR